jgi:hypothetical protein
VMDVDGIDKDVGRVGGEGESERVLLRLGEGGIAFSLFDLGDSGRPELGDSDLPPRYQYTLEEGVGGIDIVGPVLRLCILSTFVCCFEWDPFKGTPRTSRRGVTAKRLRLF